MPVRPEDIQNKKFKVVRGIGKGYDEVEVDSFLDEIEVELSRVIEENESLRQRLDAALSAPSAPPVTSEAEVMLRRTLLLAQRTADDTVAEAKTEAERMVTEARQTSTALVEAARAEAAAMTTDLERRRQALEQHIEGLRAFEREYRTRLKAYLESQLRDLDGRGAPAETPPAAPPAAPVAAPVAAPLAAPVAAPAAVPVALPAETPAETRAVDEAPAAPAVAAVPSVPGAPVPDSVPEPEPEPFDLDDGGTDVPRLAP
ncbi:MAG TPA: DivIVA domain-containing protein [Mycobacteriales bacterium]|jgi:DivIVA domain-containing protein